jgi:DNA polymerase III sliding clamp (beta) subunit (PCNA family)
MALFNTILYENEFQNPQIFQHTISLFPEQSTLAIHKVSLKVMTLTKSHFSCLKHYIPTDFFPETPC